MPGDITDDYVPSTVVRDAQVHDEKHDGKDYVNSDKSIDRPGASKIDSDVHVDPVISQADLDTLRRVSEKIPWKAYTIGFCELVERLSYYGAVQVFVNFIQYPRPGTATGKALDPNAADAQPGYLGMGQRASTGLTTFNQFWVYLMPLFGAYVADTYLGRFRTVWISVCIAIVGHIILTISAIPNVIDNGQGGAAACFIIGIIIMGVGTGGFKPSISPMIAEQIPTERMYIKTTKKGERVIVDPAVTLSRVYNWFYMCINIGALIGQISMVYAERYVGFYLSFLVPTLAFCLVLPVLYWCRKHYRFVKTEGSVLGPALKLVVLGSKGRIHASPVATYRHFTDGTFWDNVKPSRFAPGTKPKWMTFDDQWVSEVARGLAACKTFLFLPLYWLTYNQINNNLVSQASTMSLHGVPNDIVSNLDPIALIILIPVMDIWVYPLLRKMGINFTPIKRIATGFLCGSMAMIWACVIQVYIYRTRDCGSNAAKSPDCGNSSINVWAQTGSYVLIALSEIFASITSLEYAFSKAPKNMRSMVQAVALFMTAISAAIGEAFVSVSEDPLLVWNYGSMAVIAFIAGVVFYLCFKDLHKQEDALNNLPVGHMGRSDHHELESGGNRTNSSIHRDNSGSFHEKH